MPNMSYCRFVNTQAALQDCLDTMRDIEMGDERLPSDKEREMLAELVGTCFEVLSLLGAEDSDDEVEAKDVALDWIRVAAAAEADDDAGKEAK